MSCQRWRRNLKKWHSRWAPWRRRRWLWNAKTPSTTIVRALLRRLLSWRGARRRRLLVRRQRYLRRRKCHRPKIRTDHFRASNLNRRRRSHWWTASDSQLLHLLRTRKTIYHWRLWLLRRPPVRKRKVICAIWSPPNWGQRKRRLPVPKLWIVMSCLHPLLPQVSFMDTPVYHSRIKYITISVFHVAQA